MRTYILCSKCYSKNYTENIEVKKQKDNPDDYKFDCNNCGKEINIRKSQFEREFV